MKSQRGYSLVEIAIVVLIVSIMLSMGLAAFNTQITNAALSTTAKRQTALRDALAGYLVRNNRLPCPDTDNDGQENRTTPSVVTTACSSKFGTIPYVTLALSRSEALDPWENLFSYAVSNTMPRNNWTITANFLPGNGGDFTVNDRQTTNPFGTTLIANNVVAVIISHGINGDGAYTTKGTRNILPVAGTNDDELTNTAVSATYIKRPFSNVALGSFGIFDDIVLVITSEDLLAQAKREGSMLSPEAQTQKSLNDARSAIIGYAITNCTLPTTLPIAPLDGWGTALDYAPVEGVAKVPTLTTAGAYTLKSRGPDKLTGSQANDADNIVRDLDLITLRGILGQSGVNMAGAPCI